MLKQLLYTTHFIIFLLPLLVRTSIDKPFAPESNLYVEHDWLTWQQNTLLNYALLQNIRHHKTNSKETYHATSPNGTWCSFVKHFTKKYEKNGKRRKKVIQEEVECYLYARINGNTLRVRLLDESFENLENYLEEKNRSSSPGVDEDTQEDGDVEIFD